MKNSSLEDESASVGIRRIKASLRVWSDDLDPQMVTGALGAQPSDAWKRGSRRPRNRGGVARTGMWILRAGVSSVEPSDHLDDIIGQLSINVSSWTKLRATVECDVFMGIWREADSDQFFSLSPALLAFLGTHKIAVNVWSYESSPTTDSDES